MQMPSIPSKEQYDSIVQGVLDQPGYRHLKLPWIDFLENARKVVEEWVIELIRGLFDQPPVSTPFTGGVSTAVVILCVVALIACVFLAGGLFAGIFKRSPKTVGILGETITPETTPETLLEKARGAEQAGDLRQAVRYGYIAVLLKMHRARLVYLDESWTNLELYRFLEKSRFQSLSALGAVMEGFNVSWYGHKYLPGEEYTQWQNALDQVWQEVATREV